MTTPLFTVEFKKTAAKELAALERIDQARIAAAIEVLAEDPYPRGSKKLKDVNAWRIRIGDFRVIYEIHENQLVVWVIRVAKRNEAKCTRKNRRPYDPRSEKPFLPARSASCGNIPLNYTPHLQQ